MDLIDRKALIIRLIIAAFLIGLGFALAVRAVSAATITETNPKVAKQHTQDACLLGALATAMNYKSNGVNYTSAGLALAYRAKYGRSDWSKDGNTSHEAQLLAQYAGFNLEFGRLAEDSGIARLEQLALSHDYPIVFLKGNPEHAITVLGLSGKDTFEIADPFNGAITQIDATKLFYQLDNARWYVAFR